MLEKIFPKNITNEYRGHPVAKWVFVLITVMTIIRSLIHVLAPDGGAQSIATIPLDSYSSGGAATVILIFALWGLSQLLLGLVFVVVLWRCQALIPFMYLLLIIEYGARIILFHLKPIATSGAAPGGVGSYVVVSLAVIMFLLSVRTGKKDV